MCWWEKNKIPDLGNLPTSKRTVWPLHIGYNRKWNTFLVRANNSKGSLCLTQKAVFVCTSAGNTGPDTPEKQTVQEKIILASELGSDLWAASYHSKCIFKWYFAWSNTEIIQLLGTPNSWFSKEVSFLKKVTDGMKSETNFKISQILFLNGFSHTEISHLHINTFSLSCLSQGKKIWQNDKTHEVNRCSEGVHLPMS